MGGFYYAHGRWYSADEGIWMSPNEKGDYWYGGDGPCVQDTLNCAWTSDSSDRYYLNLSVSEAWDPDDPRLNHFAEMKRWLDAHGENYSLEDDPSFQQLEPGTQAAILYFRAAWICDQHSQTGKACDSAAAAMLGFSGSLWLQNSGSSAMGMEMPNTEAANETLPKGDSADTSAFDTTGAASETTIKENSVGSGDENVTKTDPLHCSFSAETVVLTDKGFKPISRIKIGDKVLGYDEKTKTTGYFPVEHVWQHDDPIIEYLTIAGETITTTPEHPFFTQEDGWVAAGKLWHGAHIREADGSYGAVDSFSFVAHSQAMYNLTVNDAHTFFVGREEWLVHNVCNKHGDEYPSFKDPRTGKEVPFPEGDIRKVDKDQRVTWDSTMDRAQYIKDWYDHGYKTPSGGWDDYDIHHILPREYGGTNDFWNLVPVERGYHNSVVTAWWNGY